MNIFEALIAAKRDIGAIAKNKKNAQQGFYFRGIDDAYNYLHGVLAKHGIVTVPEVLNVERQERTTVKGAVLIYSILTMKYTFYSEDGSSIAATVIGEGMDSGDKASNKAMSVAHKYALLQVFMVPTEEMADPEGDSHDLIASPEPRTLAALEKLTGDNAERKEWLKAQLGKGMTEAAAQYVINEWKKRDKEKEAA